MENSQDNRLLVCTARRQWTFRLPSRDAALIRAKEIRANGFASRVGERRAFRLVRAGEVTRIRVL